jgi:hypothetical protein
MLRALLSSMTILCAVILAIACRAAPLDQLKSLNLDVPSVVIPTLVSHARLY